jgi:hypothetical protein
VPPTSTSIPLTVIPTNTPVPTNTPLATATSVSPTSTPTPTGITLQSQGLGITFEDWKAIHGEPTQDLGGGLYIYDNPGYYYSIIVDDDRLSFLHRQWAEGTFPSFAVAKFIAQTLSPRDAVFESSYTTSTGTFVEVYFSQQLATVYPNGPYIGGEIGEFTVSYHLAEDGTVFGMIVATGNNP